MVSAFYAQYVAACADLFIEPLSELELLALISALLERRSAVVH